MLTHDRRDAAAETVLAETLQFDRSDTARQASPQLPDKIFRDEAGVIRDVKPGAYTFTVGPGDAEGIQMRAVDLVLRAGARRDRRARPAGRLLADGGRLHRPGAGLASRRRPAAKTPIRSRRRRAGAGAGSRRPMNYRHAYHAGNFADVVKHAVLTRLVEYLKQKDKAFRVIDTHAGIGLYDLSSDEAQKTGEWQGGIGRLLDAELAAEAAALLAPYLDAVRAAQCRAAAFATIPGSPLIARHLLRKQDRLSAIELHPEDVAAPEDAVRRRFPGPRDRTRRLAGAWRASAAQGKARPGAGRSALRGGGRVRPAGRRPEKAHKRWPGGIYALWYPIKDRTAVAAFRTALAAAGIPKILDIELRRSGRRRREPRLDGSGMVVVNPPFTLESGNAHRAAGTAQVAGARSTGAGWSLEWLAGEAARRLTASRGC